MIALTFDDGPDSLQTPKVLQVLKEYQATACFFCIGHKIKGNEALLKSMVTEGHLLGIIHIAIPVYFRYMDSLK